MEEIIRVENLTHTYGEGTPFCRSAVQDMSLAIYRGEFLGIIGHTGSGKSTLIQHLNGLLKPTSGRILLGGEDIWSDPKKIRDVRFRVGLVFQYPEYQLFEETVYRDIAFGPTNMGLSKDEIDRRVRESAHFAGLTDDLLENRRSPSPADRSAAWPSRASLRWSPRCSCSTSRARALTRRAGKSCFQTSANSTARAARPSCS